MLSLSHSPAQILQRLLVSLNVASAPEENPLLSWPVYARNEPDSPDNVITCRDTLGRTSTREMVQGTYVDYHGLQLRLRSAAPTEGFAKMAAIVKKLDEDVYLTPVQIDSSVYTVLCISRTGTILPIGSDKPNSRRNLFTVNLLMTLNSIVLLA